MFSKLYPKVCYSRVRYFDIDAQKTRTLGQVSFGRLCLKNEYECGNVPLDFCVEGINTGVIPCGLLLTEHTPYFMSYAQFCLVGRFARNSVKLDSGIGNACIIFLQAE